MPRQPRKQDPQPPAAFPTNLPSVTPPSMPVRTEFDDTRLLLQRPRRGGGNLRTALLGLLAVAALAAGMVALVRHGRAQNPTTPVAATAAPAAALPPADAAAPTLAAKAEPSPQPTALPTRDLAKALARAQAKLNIPPATKGKPLPRLALKPKAKPTAEAKATEEPSPTATPIVLAAQPAPVSATAAAQPASPAQPGPNFPMTFMLPQSTGDPAEVMVFPAAKGRALKVLRGDPAVPGEAKLVWDGKDDQGNVLPAGKYFLRLRSSNDESIQEVVIP